MLYLHKHASFLWGNNEGSLGHRGLFSGQKRISEALPKAGRGGCITVVAKGTTVVAVQTAGALQPYFLSVLDGLVLFTSWLIP